MILEIVLYPDPILKTPTQPIERIEEDIQELAQNMIETMYAKQGIGLAAPQVGSLKRLTVIDISEEKNSPLVLINPYVVRQSGSQVYEEGCLSFPGLYGKVERAAEVDVEYLDQAGNPQKIQGATGLFAIVLQHEIDHLDGLLFIQRMSPAEKLKHKKALKAFENQYKQKQKSLKKTKL
ncbi:MAG: peptide deformylase [Planctomycetota bacterium]|nr:MAG: peptide deformylase [Planctomycetota bacterium]